MVKLKVKPSNGSKKDFSLGRRSSAWAQLEGMYRLKLKKYFHTQVENTLNNVENQRTVKSFAELGSYIYGFRWSSASFRDEALAPGSAENRADLLRHSLLAALQIASDRATDQKREDENGFVAMSTFLHFIAEILSLITTIFLFLENETWEAWTFVAVTIASRLFQIGTVAFLQNGTFVKYLGALSGLSLITDAYRIVSQKRDYTAQVGKLDFGLVGVIRKTGVAIIQFIPQTVLNIHIIVTKLEEKGKFSGLLWIQIMSISATILSFSISLTKFNTDRMSSEAKENHYISMSQYMPHESKQMSRQIMNVVSLLWHMTHMLIVCTGVGTLISRAPITISLSLIGGFICVVNVLRLVINRGELRYFLRMKSTLFNNTLSILGTMLVYSIGPAIMPLSMMRYACALGPTVFGFVWITSFGMSAGVVFFFVKDVVFLAFFGMLCFFYVVVVAVFFGMLRKNYWKTFLFSTTNWKDALRDEIWENVEFGTNIWNNDVLLGDEDAHYASLVKLYLAADLPWDKLSAWLHAKKDEFVSDPPIWLSEEWLLLIPVPIREEVWTANDIDNLKDSIRQGRANFQHFGESVNVRVIRDEQRIEASSSNTDDNSIGNDSGRKAGQKPQTQMKVHPVTDRSDTKLALQSLLEKGELLSRTSMVETVYSFLDEDLARAIIESRNFEIHEDVPALIVEVLLEYFRKNNDNEKTNIFRVLIAAFFEIGDEVSDIVLAILFALNPEDLQWAATLMFVFMGLNRVVNAMNSLGQQEHPVRIFEALLGIKCVTDSFRLLTQGAKAQSGKASIYVIRAQTLMVGLVFESLPQMMLQLIIVLSTMKKNELNQGVIAAQITSVLASCISIASSFATMSVDQAAGQRKTHPSTSKWLPKNDKFRETILLISLVGWYFLHILLTVCGFSILMAFADITVSLPIIFGNFALFTILRYVINDSGWRGLGVYSVKGVRLDMISVPFGSITFFVLASTVPFLIIRYQCVIGPFLFTYGVVSSIIICMVSIFTYIVDSSMKIFFASLFILYVLVVCIFLAHIDEELFSFLFSTVNWKETLRDELWDIAIHGSRVWKIPNLLDDHDANHAGLIRLYKASDLPWERIKAWLKSKKAPFLENPPLWMTPDWFDNLTPEVKKFVWEETGELEELIMKVKEARHEAPPQNDEE